MAGKEHVVLRGAAFALLAGLALAVPACRTTVPPPVAYDHFTIVNASDLPVREVRFLVADAGGAVFDEMLLRQGAPVHPREEVTWVRNRYAEEPPLEQVRCELLYDGPQGETELSATVPTDPWGPDLDVRFQVRERPDAPGELELVVE